MFSPSPTPTNAWLNTFCVASQPRDTPLVMPVLSTTPQACVVTPHTVRDNACYLDFGVTHHLINSASIMDQSTPYIGPGKVCVGNGSTLLVLHTTQTSLLTCSRPLYMISLLFVPDITKNMLFVSKFTNDNQVVFKISPTKCQMRDLQTREVLFQGTVHDGLYKLQFNANVNSSLPTPTIVKSIPLAVWHARLGHPCFATLKIALTHCNVPVIGNKTLVECVVCHLGK